MRVLAISGSLRKASLNSALLRACTRLAPPDVEVALYTGVGSLPLFNPDLDADLPAPVVKLRAAIAAADALLIASPEYAHGVSGPLKNALDWLVSGPEVVHKPVAVLNASPRARHADAALRETLVTMSARLVEPASLGIPVLAADLVDGDLPTSPRLQSLTRAALDALRDAVKQP